MPLIINAELQSLIPQLTTEEYTQLEVNILADGCHDPLMVWQEEQTLLDGHNRLEICERHGLPYTTEEVSLAGLDAAKAWMIANQLGRRNLSREQASYLRGAQYTLQKHLSRGGGDHRSPDATDQKVHSEPFDDTATRLAKDYKVSRSTIKRDGAYADAIDTLADTLGPDVRQTILARETNITRDGVTQLAALARVDSAAAQAALTDIQAAPTVKEAREALTRHVGAGQENGPSSEERTESPAPPTLMLTQDAAPPEAPPNALEILRNRWGTVTEPHLPPDQCIVSGDGEWYTPPEAIVLVQQVLGTIDVDPASCADAQAVVGAQVYYTRDDDGLRHPWHGTVFCNPPYTMPTVARFGGKLLDEIDAGHTTAAIFLINSITDTAVFHTMAPRAALVCLTARRLEFWHPTRPPSHPSQGQAIFYFGPDAQRFADVFGAVGMVMQVWRARDGGPQLPLPQPASRSAQVPLSEHEALLMAAMAQTPDGLSAQDAGQVLGENALLAGKVLKTLEGLRLLTKEGRHYHLKQQGPHAPRRTD
jgi:hypothetical protein